MECDEPERRWANVVIGWSDTAEASIAMHKTLRIFLMARLFVWVLLAHAILQKSNHGKEALFEHQAKTVIHRQMELLRAISFFLRNGYGCVRNGA